MANKECLVGLQDLSCPDTQVYVWVTQGYSSAIEPIRQVATNDTVEVFLLKKLDFYL